MNYVPPKDVMSPRDAVKKVKVLYDGGEDSVSIAEITWFNKTVTGMRWNVSMREWDDENKNGKRGSATCLGNPISRGYPTWFILPEGLFNGELNLSEIVNQVKQRLILS